MLLFWSCPGFVSLSPGRLLLFHSSLSCRTQGRRKCHVIVSVPDGNSNPRIPSLSFPSLSATTYILLGSTQVLDVMMWLNSWWQVKAVSTFHPADRTPHSSCLSMTLWEDPEDMEIYHSSLCFCLYIQLYTCVKCLHGLWYICRLTAVTFLFLF